MQIKLGNVVFKKISLTLLVPLIGHNANLFITKHVYEASSKCLNAVNIQKYFPFFSKHRKKILRDG